MAQTRGTVVGVPSVDADSGEVESPVVLLEKLLPLLPLMSWLLLLLLRLLPLLLVLPPLLLWWAGELKTSSALPR